MIRIVVVNKDDKTGTHLCNKLNEQHDFDVVGSGKDAYEAVKLAKAHKPDIVLMDIDSNWETGIQTVSLIKYRHSSTAVIVRGACPDDPRAIKALGCGCSAYLHKDTSPELLHHSIRAAFCGGCLVPPQIMATVHQALTTATTEDAAPDYGKPVLPDTLSNTELRIMGFIGQGLTTKEIAAQMRLGSGTIRNYTSSLMQKMNLNGRTQVAAYVNKAGF